MPNPVGLNTTTIHAKYVEPNSTATPLQGTVTFTPNPAVITFPTENVVVAGTETATLDVNGEFVIELISTDQAGENPTGWTYTVTEKLIGQKQRTYNIALPYNNGTTVELADITPTDAAPTYIPVVGPVGSPGLITSVNGHSAASITLTSSDVGAIPTTAEGVANGVATLNASGVIPLAQYDGASVVLVSTRGVANGVATLDATGLVPSAQLALASSAPPSVGTSATGTSTNLARQDHSHDGVDLVNAQSIAGAKNFTTSVQAAQLGVGVAPGGSRVAVQSAADEIMLLLVNTVNAPSSAAILTILNQSTDISLGARISGDTSSRFTVTAAGGLSWGPGNAATDVTLFRSSSSTLQVTGHIQVTQHLATLAGGRIIQFGAAGTDLLYSIFINGDSVDRFEILGNGDMHWGSGTGALDTNLYRASASVLKTDSAFTAVGDITGGGNLNLASGKQVNIGGNSSLAMFTSLMATSGTLLMTGRVSGDSSNRIQIGADGFMQWGPGSATVDTNLYRTAVNTLRTDSNWQVGGIGQEKYSAKTSDETRTNTTTYQDDSALAISLDANSTYVIDGYLTYIAPNAATGIAIALYYTGTSSMGTWTPDGESGSVSADTGTIRRAVGVIQNISNASTASGFGLSASATPNPLAVKPYGVIRTTTAGTLRVCWTQYAANAAATTLQNGSWLRVKKLA